MASLVLPEAMTPAQRTVAAASAPTALEDLKKYEIPGHVYQRGPAPPPLLRLAPDALLLMLSRFLEQANSSVLPLRHVRS